MFLLINCNETDQKKQFIILGDIHYDKIEDHDMDWLKTKPDDYRQVIEYTDLTEKYFDLLINEILSKSKKSNSRIQAIIQLGDLQEGLAGTPELAESMTVHARDGLRANEFSIPWILVKGNHDITGPGAKEAYQDIMLPFLEQELNTPISNPSYSYEKENIKIIVLDCYDRENLLEFLENELSSSTAKYNIIATHQPVIPMTARCWHIFNHPKQSNKREQLLSLIAQHKALVLSAHLHKYSIVRRETPDGPIVQLSINSVVKDPNQSTPYWIEDTYGSAMVDLEPDFSPDTRENRKAFLEKEGKKVTYFKLADMPGYAILEFDNLNNSINVKTFSGIGNSHYETINLSDLLK